MHRNNSIHKNAKSTHDCLAISEVRILVNFEGISCDTVGSEGDCLGALAFS